jgi:hypothetical protein
MKRTLLLLSSLLAVLSVSRAQTQLAAGDIAFIAIQSGATGQTVPDRFAFVLLKAIESGTSIVFTDNAILNPAQNAKYCRNEGFCNWTAGSSLPAGKVVEIAADSTTNTGTVLGNINLSQSGDQIIAFQALGSDSVALAAISTTGFETVCGTACGGTNNNKTCLPAGLSNGLNAISFPTEQNNAFFNLDDLSGSAADLLAQINNPANWTRADTLQTWNAGVWTLNVTSLKSRQAEQAFDLFPNPASDFVEIKMKNTSGLTCRISDARGQYLPVIWKGNNRLDISRMRPGIYTLQLISADGSVAEAIRLLKE